MRQFQDAGHVAILIIGDFTGRIGDPSGRSKTRPMLDEDEIRTNAESYLAQAGRVIDVDAAEIHGNTEWLATMEMGELLRLASTATIAQMLEREDFRGRYQGDTRSASSSSSIRCSRATRSRSGPTSSSAGRTRRSTC